MASFETFRPRRGVIVFLSSVWIITTIFAIVLGSVTISRLNDNTEVDPGSIKGLAIAAIVLGLLGFGPLALILAAIAFSRLEQRLDTISK